MVTHRFVPDPLLIEGARYALHCAPLNCGKGVARGETVSCDWYHGFWPQLRLLGLGSDPLRHSDFFESALERLPRRRDPLRVLVCGTADFAMPALVRQRCLALDLPCEITVLDRCPTPLLLSRWHADRMDWSIATVTADLMEWRSTEVFDLIITHSFFPLFPPQDRSQVAAAWRELLRPGGRVITVSRVGTDSGIVESSVAAAQLADAAVRKARARPEACVMPVDAIAAAAAEFARRLPVHPMGDVAATRQLFEAQGFSLRCFQVRRSPGAARLASTSVGVAKPAEYAEIVAERC
ncbi:MAG: class I SAM-dependent methyltransferase [Pseudomonadota bacterium]|nr:class I SAM-dependent methyltransferase [Pseudomonadota bacterium]